MNPRATLGMGPVARVATILFFAALLVALAGLLAAGDWRWVLPVGVSALGGGYLALGRVRHLTLYRGGEDWYASILAGHLWLPKRAEIHRLAGAPRFTVEPATGPYDEHLFALVLAGADGPVQLALYHTRTEAEALVAGLTRAGVPCLLESVGSAAPDMAGSITRD